MLKAILLYFAYMLLCVKVFAQGEFIVPVKYYSPDEIINVTFSYPKCAADIKIKPKSTKGTIEIFNPENNVWQKSSQSWSSQPLLTKQLKIRTTNVAEQKTDLTFELQNVKTGQVTESSPLGLWITDFPSIYIDSLNQNILAQ